MASLKQELRARLAYLDQATRDQVINDALSVLERPTRDMVDEGRRLLREERSDWRRGSGHDDLWLAETLFGRMVAAGHWGGA